MSLRLKVAENQLEPLEISFTIQMLRVSTTMQKECLCHKRPALLARVTFIAARGKYCYQEFMLFKQNISTILSAGRGQNYIPESLFLQPEVSITI